MKRNTILLFVIIASLLGLASCNNVEKEPATSNNTNSEKLTAPKVPVTKSEDFTEPEVPAVAQVTDNNNVDGPRIVFENKLVEFGKVGPESKPSGEFTFINKGNADLEIESVSQCCGVVITFEEKKYKPGEKGAIKVTYTPSKQAGKLTRMPIVTSNDPIEPTVSLLLTVEVVNKVVAEPETLKLFIDEDNADTPKLTLKSTDGKSFSIRKIQSTGNCITAQFDPNVNSTAITLDLNADIEKLRKNNAGYVDFVITHPDMSIVTIAFDVVSRFTVTPAKITALNTDPGVPVVRKIWIFNRYNKDFDIESITTKNNYIAILNQGKNEDSGYQIEIQITPPPSEGKTYFNDELYIKIKNNETLTIQCDGFYNLPND